MHRPLAVKPFLLIGLVLSLGCSNKTPEPSHQRIVSLVPSATEILYALGVEERLVGVTTFCDYPEEAKSKPKVGDFSNPSIERILALNPDIVFATTPEQLRILKKLQNLGIRTEIISPESIDEIVESIKRIGEITHRENRAIELVEQLVKEKEILEEKVKKLGKRPRVYIELDRNPLFTAGRGSFVNQLIELAGGENIVENDRAYLPINSEVVIAKDPEIIILAYPGTKEEVSSRIGWQSVSAVRNGRIYDEVDPNLITRPGPRCIKGAFELFKRFHPEIR